MSTFTNDDAKLDELLFRWEDARKRGETLTVELLCVDFPELAGELRQQIKAVCDFELLEALADEPASACITAQLSELHSHARGGLGRIYKAFHAGLAREVALKFLREDRARDPEIVSRFRREARITARLEHPGIVPIYGMGRDEAGNLCYAMRFIEGKTLDESIEACYGERKSDTRHWPRTFRRLLERFKNACTTVAYAHSRGVLHRDLKPPNIMFGPFDETLVLDWGLGKITGGDAITPGGGEQEASAPLLQSEEIQTRRLIGTPGFMSPEQHAGLWDKVGPASDIYSLGATLYVLLTGKSPFEGRSPDEIATKVKQGEFTPPRQLNPDVPRALEAVCLKAMALETQDRYHSALELASDLENWLAGEPVTAWREPLLIQARRGLARRRTLVWGLRVASILAVLAAAFSLGVLFWSNRELAQKNQQLEQANRRVEEARDRALGHFDVALRAIEHFHRAVSLNLDVKDRPDLKPLRTELLQAPLEFYRLLKQDLQQHAEGQPETSARFADAVAGLAQITGEIDSEPNAIRAYQDAIEVLTTLDRDHPESTKYAFALAKVFRSLGLLQLDTNQLENAIVSEERALSLYRRLADVHPTDERYRFGVARVASQLGVAKRTLHRPVEAMASYQDALVLLEELVRDHPKDDLYQSELAHLFRNVGVLHRAAGKPEPAMRNYEQARAVFQILVARHPSVASYRQGLANCHFNIANLHIDAGRNQEIMNALVQARKIQQGLVHDFPTVGRFQADLARVYGQLGTFLNFQGRPEESLANLEEARKILVGLARDHREVINYRIDLELTNYHIGCMLSHFGRYAQALDSLKQARDFFDSMVTNNANDLRSRLVLAATWDDTGHVLRGMQRHSDAAAAYEQAILNQQRAHDHQEADARTRGECMHHLVTQHEDLAETYVRLNRPTDAINSLVRAGETLNRQPESAFGQAYFEARICCRLIGLLNGKEQTLTAAQIVQRGELVDRALRAIRRGFPSFERGFKQLNEDKMFDPLRGNAEFQMILLDLAFPANPLKP